jgi:hypothetical protein
MKKYHTWKCRWEAFKGSLYMIPLSIFLGLAMMLLPMAQEADPVKPIYKTERIIALIDGYYGKKSLY